MKKFFAEIIAGMIPEKMARNRWRGILRFGLRNSLKLQRQIKANHSLPQHYLAICAISKNEGSYLKEWVEWHLENGVDIIYFYDNESTDNTREILKPYIETGRLIYHFFPGYRVQLAAYDDCLARYRFDSRWIAFIDIDEFIVPIRDKSIPEFLKKFEQFPSVEINWLIYGSGGATEKSDEPVMKRFKKHSVPEHPLNRHVKSIIDPRRVYGMIGCHEAARISGKAADSHGAPIQTNFKERNPQQDVIKINHYAVKSKEEFVEKQGRGRASGRQRSISEEYFRAYDLNDIEDESLTD